VEGSYQIRCHIRNQYIYYNSAVDIHTIQTKAEEIFIDGNAIKGLDFQLSVFRDAISGRVLMLDSISPHANVVV